MVLTKLCALKIKKCKIASEPYSFVKVKPIFDSNKADLHRENYMKCLKNNPGIQNKADLHSKNSL